VTQEGTRSKGFVMRRLRNFWQRSRQPSLEIHVPISPTPIFLNMLRCLALSLRRRGGAYCHAPIVATVGSADVNPRLSRYLPWLRPLGVELRWLPREEFLARDYFATGHQRFKYRHRADVVLLLDADTLIAGPLDELVHIVHEQNAIAGFIAHICPFERAQQHEVDWDVLFRHCGLKAPTLVHQHTGWGALSTDERRRLCPAYFNYGVVCLTRTMCRRIAPILDRLFDRVREICPTVYAAQLALAAAIAKLELPAIALPMRWNCPNAPELEALQPEEVPQARILHLLGQPINKAEIFATVDSLRAFSGMPNLTGTSARAQDIIREMLPSLEVHEQRFAA
jgi:hypothetical protein